MHRIASTVISSKVQSSGIIINFLFLGGVVFSMNFRDEQTIFGGIVLTQDVLQVLTIMC